MQHKTMHVSNTETHTSVKTIAKTIGKRKLGNITNPKDNLLVTLTTTNPSKLGSPDMCQATQDENSQAHVGEIRLHSSEYPFFRHLPAKSAALHKISYGEIK